MLDNTSRTTLLTYFPCIKLYYKFGYEDGLFPVVLVKLLPYV